MCILPNCTGLLQHLASVLHGDMLAAEYTLLALAAKALRVAGRQPTHQVHTSISYQWVTC
jgi:hypothetical protein